MISFAMNQRRIVIFEAAYVAIFAIGISVVRVSTVEAAPTTAFAD